MRAAAVRWVEDGFPGWAELVLADAAGRSWHLVDKVPVFGDERLTADAAYPFDVRVDCDVLRDNGDGVVLVALRHGVVADDGTGQFVVARDHVDGG